MFVPVIKKAISIFNRITHSTGFVKLTIVFLFLSFVNTEKIRYFQPQTILLEPHNKEVYEVDMNDSIPENNLLYKLSSENGIPVSFYREIFTSVCFDNKCRPLSINLYWNITGRYLGFELLEGEFLSKTDHEPFSVEEYEKLNQILATEDSPLAHIEYSQLTVEPDSHGFGDIDAISSATPQNLTPYVIKGAAYTTFKLWHFIYGPTKKEVQKLTIKEISPELIVKILESPDQFDKIWALEHIDGYVVLTPELKFKIFELINGNVYALVDKALNSINKSELNSAPVQDLLVEALLRQNYNLQILVIDKIEGCVSLNDSSKMKLIDNLGDFNGQVFKQVLEVLEENKLTIKMYYKIAELLQSENRFISRNIEMFLRNKDIKDPKILSLLEKKED